jgi:hypothetical protein
LISLVFYFKELIEPDEQEIEQVINVEIPKIKSNFGKEMHFVKLPNFLSFDPK